MAEKQGTPFSKMYEDANHWVNEIASRMGRPDKQHAYHALRGVLFALRDRLPVTEAFGLASQLPTIVRGVYFEGYSPAGKPEKVHRDAFMAKVSAELQKVGDGQPEAAVTAVIRVLKEQVGEDQLAHVFNVLPEDLQETLQTV